MHEDKSTSIVDGVEVPNKGFTYIFDAATRKIKVTFKEGVEATTACFIEVDLWFDLTAGGQTDPVSYVFPVRELLEKRANFYFKPETSGNAVSKQGILYRSGTPTDKNPNEIFRRGEINRNLDVIAANELTVIENTFRSETLEYKVDLIKVFPLEVEEYDEIIEIDILIPEGVVNLPKTSGLPAMVYFVSGSAFLIVSWLVRKRK